MRGRASGKRAADDAMTTTTSVSESGRAPAPASGSRVKFQAIAETDDAASLALSGFEPWAGAAADRRDRDLEKAARQISLFSRLAAIFIFFTMLVGWPAGTLVGHYGAVGSLRGWDPAVAFPSFAVMFAIFAPPLIWLLGYMFSRLVSMMLAAESIAAAAQQFVQPDRAAIANVETVGTAVRGQMDAINAGIDDALIRLASAESMIRRHVEAIESAGLAIETRTVGAVDKVAVERTRLIELTEHLNARADDFATAIAERAQASIESLSAATDQSHQAEVNLEDRLARLESAARHALQSFNALATALVDADQNLRTAATSIGTAAGEAREASEQASRVADAAAESAARNALNVGQFARTASEAARRAADEAIETASRETERAAAAAVEFTTRESTRIARATVEAIEQLRAASEEAVEAASSEASRATEAVAQISGAAADATRAARAAAEDVRRASEEARETAEAALASSSASAETVERRNRELADARAALEAENARLEGLIDEQRKRADRLAEAIATQTERLSRLAEAQLREQEATARIAEAQAAQAAHAAAHAAARASGASQDGPSREDAASSPQRAEGGPSAPRSEPAAASPRSAGNERSAPRAINPVRPNTAEDAETRKKPAAAPGAGPQPGAPPGGARREEPLDMRKAARTAPASETPAPESRVAEDRSTGSRTKEGVSWREILTATDDAEPLDLGKAARIAPDAGGPSPKHRQHQRSPQQASQKTPDAVAAVRIIQELQSFTLDLETRLYGAPPPALLERFERGDRNIFANRLLRLNEADVKRRMRSESARDRSFEKAIHQFLQGFERLLEDATTSETADEELEEYLSSPLGRVYLLIGATVGYFA